MRNKIGLIDVDSKIPNLALMKLSAIHKLNGDYVEFFKQGEGYDKVYASKVFKGNHPRVEGVIYGGSGIDLGVKLEDSIEHICPDYSLYGADYAMGFTTRGCIRECGFCIVPRKEGKIKQVADIYEFWRNQESLMILDGNLTADNSHFELICGQLIKHKIKTFFSQGLDIRLMDETKAELLNKVKLMGRKRIYFAWDSLDVENEVIGNLKKVLKYIRPYKIMFYILIGWGTTWEEDLYRVELLKSMKIDSFVMPYDRSSSYQRNFARWVNSNIYRSVNWLDYKCNRV